jgi:glycosyltransferase involved in cell wall biosynthesis
MNKIKVSIIIAAYNVEKYIERCICSATNQTLEEIEIIVINDGSTDDTSKIIDDLSKKDKRVKVFHKENGGLASVRNLGVEKANGEYIQHLDGDDWVEKDASWKMYYFAKEKNLDIVISDFYKDDDNGNVKLCKDIHSEYNIYTKEEYLEYLLNPKSYNSLWNKIFKKELYAGVQCPEEISVGEDMLQVTMLTLKAQKIGKVSEAFLHYIYNPSSITNNSLSKKIYQLFYVYDAIIDMMKRKGVYCEYEYKLHIHKFDRVSAFIGLQPYYGDQYYEKSFQCFLEYLRTAPKIPSNINKVKSLMMRFLITFPSKRNLKFIIVLANLIKKYKK